MTPTRLPFGRALRVYPVTSRQPALSLRGRFETSAKSARHRPDDSRLSGPLVQPDVLKSMAQNNFISEALCNPTDYIAYSVSEKLGELFAGKAVVEGESDLFELEQYARAGLCAIVCERGTHGQFSTIWRGAGRSLEQEAQNAWFNVLWQGQLLEVVFITWTESGYRSRFHWIVADTREVAEKFYRTVCEWSAEG